MKLAALTFTRIDGDVLEEFLRYTARFVDHHYLGIMGSSDAALAIAKALVAEGLPITIWRLSSRASLEGDPRMTAPFARLIFDRQNCDYLLPLDADEFVVARDRGELERALGELPAGAHGLAYWTKYVPSKHDDAAEPRVLARIRYRRTSETHAYAIYAILPGKKIVLTRDAADPDGLRFERSRNLRTWHLHTAHLRTR